MCGSETPVVRLACFDANCFLIISNLLRLPVDALPAGSPVAFGKNILVEVVGASMFYPGIMNVLLNNTINNVVYNKTVSYTFILLLYSHIHVCQLQNFIIKNIANTLIRLQFTKQTHSTECNTAFHQIYYIPYIYLFCVL